MADRPTRTAALMESISRNRVLVILGLVVAVAIVIDIVLATDPVEGNTFSELIRIAADNTPAVPWMVGLVLGHWFHPGETMSPVIPAPWNGYAILGITGVALIAGGPIGLDPWLVCAVGFVVGWLVWPVATPRLVPPMIERA